MRLGRDDIAGNELKELWVAAKITCLGVCSVPLWGTWNEGLVVSHGGRCLITMVLRENSL